MEETCRQQIERLDQIRWAACSSERTRQLHQKLTCATFAASLASLSRAGRMPWRLRRGRRPSRRSSTGRPARAPARSSGQTCSIGRRDEERGAVLRTASYSAISSQPARCRRRLRTRRSTRRRRRLGRSSSVHIFDAFVDATKERLILRRAFMAVSFVAVERHVNPFARKVARPGFDSRSAPPVTGAALRSEKGTERAAPRLPPEYPVCRAPGLRRSGKGWLGRSVSLSSRRRCYACAATACGYGVRVRQTPEPAMGVEQGNQSCPRLDQAVNDADHEEHERDSSRAE